jgi:predicted nuclease with TOPRIM domain
MQLESAAVLFVFVGNAAAIIMLAFMLFRILGQTTETHDMVRKDSQALLGAAKRLHDLLSGVDRLSDRLIEANKLAAQANQPLSLTEDSLQKITALTDSLTRTALEEHEKIVDDMRTLLASLQAIRPEGYPEWHQQHGEKLDQTLAQRAHASLELEQVKLRLDEAQVVITELRRANRLAEASSQSVDALRQSLEQHQVLLNRAKERAQKAEASSNTLRQEVDKLQGELEKARHEAAHDADALRGQLEAISGERNVLFNQLEELRGTMQRVLREKDFIEDKLLDLDEASRADSKA